MPGAGKSYFGKWLSDTFNYKFIDLDSYIENKESKSIKDIIKFYGESYFRELEYRYLREASVNCTENTIISCGGGTPCYFRNITTMNSFGKMIHLDTSIFKIYKRCLKSKDRPLFKNKFTLFFKLIKLKNERAIYYSFADIYIRL